jgi:hypothetical protein
MVTTIFQVSHSSRTLTQYLHIVQFRCAVIIQVVFFTVPITNHPNFVGFEVFTEANMKMAVFWVVALPQKRKQ